MSSVKTSLTLDAEVKEELQRIAEENDRSLAWVLRQAIQEYLKKYNEEN